jgi:hypothetical protein
VSIPGPVEVKVHFLELPEGRFWWLAEDLGPSQGTTLRFCGPYPGPTEALAAHPDWRPAHDLEVARINDWQGFPRQL